MGFNRFSLLLSLRVALTMTTLLLAAWLISQPGYHASMVVVFAMLILQLVETLHFVGKTNAELTRFLDAARYGEFTQRFEFKRLGSGFEQLGEAFTDILHRFQVAREEQEQQLRHLKAIVDHVPVPLISLHPDGCITQWNNSARRLLGSGNINKLEDLAQFDPALPQKLKQLLPGQRELMNFDVDGMSHQLAVSATQILLAQKQEKLFSLQDIRSELDMAQVQAWQDLVRVLTHEIMNSITPVASLAKTASDMMEDLIGQSSHVGAFQSELHDIQHAVQTVARRSDGLTQFVGSYRQLTRLPAPQKKWLDMASLLNQVVTVATQDWDKANISLTIKLPKEGLQLEADPNMLEQVLINLLKNAEHALQNTGGAEVVMSAYLNRRGHTVIEVKDNGPGIPEDILDKVFVPFFTTKREGSGVGLALTRQVMIAHGGSARVHNIPSAGACFTLTF